MSKYAWATDVHLDHLGGDNNKIISFAESLVKDNPTGIFLTGDISNSKEIIYHLSALEKIVERPIYFVLGNHDYYGGNIEKVRKLMRELSGVSQYLKYMPDTPYIALSNSTAVVGHDGWYDALHGDWRQSRFMMSDWAAIQDFVQFSGGAANVQSGRLTDREGIVTLSRKLAHEGATYVRDAIKRATRYHKNIVVLTHFPPFEKAHIYNGAPPSPSAVPWYTSKIMGDMLIDAARAYPKVNFIVLAGHTHGKISVKIEKNLDVHVGYAEYGQPELASLIDVT